MPLLNGSTRSTAAIVAVSSRSLRRSPHHCRRVRVHLADEPRIPQRRALTFIWLTNTSKTVREYRVTGISLKQALGLRDRVSSTSVFESNTRLVTNRRVETS